jgi:hypothetical protein
VDIIDKGLRSLEKILKTRLSNIFCVAGLEELKQRSGCPETGNANNRVFMDSKGRWLNSQRSRYECDDDYRLVQVDNKPDAVVPSGELSWRHKHKGSSVN